MRLRFLDVALSRLGWVEEGASLAVDGKTIYYNPLWILRRYKAEQNAVSRDYFHAALHCIFHHNFISTLVDQLCWDIACDIAVENVINELNLSVLHTQRQDQQRDTMEQFRQKVPKMNAEKLYSYLLDQRYSTERLLALQSLFAADDHSIWYEIAAKASNEGGEGQAGEDAKGRIQLLSMAELQEMKADWESIAQRMQIELEDFAQEQGIQAGGLLQNIREVTREKYDYAEFLKKFAVYGEVMKIDPDEFDMIFYTYGLQLYEKMPLIEPLEYRQTKRIREFVIAIDTSGSVSGELVQKFIQKTYNILLSQESFFSKVNIHIIQCDAEIQEAVKVTSQEEFQRYIKTMQLKGFGGTDFRPVFRYIEEQKRIGEFRDLRGMIYFTDGYGIFPERQPDYNTAFVFVEEDDFAPEVPVWAIRLVLRENEI